MPVVIADASPLAALSLIDRLEWLPQLFGIVHAVPSVMQEVLTDRFAKSENNIRFAVGQGWLLPVETEIPSVDHIATAQMIGWKQLDTGEADSIAYAAALSSTVKPHPTLLLMD